MAITVKVWRQRSKNTQKTQKGGSADRKKDIAYRRQIAELWNMESVKTIAKMHQRGLGKAAKVNMEKAVTWYKRAANAGDFESAKELGEIYDYGRGVEVDKSKAVRWYEKALEAGEEEIRREDEGELFCVSGTKEDKKETMAMIMLRLSEMYAAGIGTPVDEERAATLKARANAERQVSEGTLKKLFQFIGRVCRGWN